MDRRAFQGLVERQRRRNPRQPPRQHRLASPRRTAEQQVVPPSRGDLQRPAREQLPAHVREVALGGWRRRPGRSAGRRRECRLVRRIERLDRLVERADRQISSPSTTQASGAFCGGSSSRRKPSLRAATAIGRTPGCC
jgi:hypothetical protein